MDIRQLQCVSPNHMRAESHKTPSLLLTFSYCPYLPGGKHGEIDVLSATEKGLGCGLLPFIKQIEVYASYLPGPALFSSCVYLLRNSFHILPK